MSTFLRIVCCRMCAFILIRFLFWTLNQGFPEKSALFFKFTSGLSRGFNGFYRMFFTGTKILIVKLRLPLIFKLENRCHELFHLINFFSFAISNNENKSAFSQNSHVIKDLEISMKRKLMMLLNFSIIYCIVFRLLKFQPPLILFGDKLLKLRIRFKFKLIFKQSDTFHSKSYRNWNEI